MAAKLRALTDEDYIVIGRRHGSDGVASEGKEAGDRWQRDLVDLKPYGFGAKLLGDFLALLAEHETGRVSRPQAVSAKATAIDAREQAVAAGWDFVEQTVAALSLPSLSDTALANALNAAVPADTAGLSVGIGAVAGVLRDYKRLVDPEFDADAMIGRAVDLANAVTREIGGATLAKGVPAGDTRQIDLLDGKIVTVIRRLNKAARKAFRRLDNDVKVGEYRYHHLEQRKRTRAPQPAPPTP